LCRYAAGPISIKYSKTIPAFIPPGAYTIEFHATVGRGTLNSVDP
jgi:hypothetical protein